MFLNRSFVSGNISNLKSGNSGGRAYAMFTIKTDEEDDAPKVNIIAWDEIASAIAGDTTLRTNSLVFVEGRLNCRKAQDASGNTVHVTEVIAEEVQVLADPAPASQPAAEDSLPPAAVDDEPAEQEPEDPPEEKPKTQKRKPAAQKKQEAVSAAAVAAAVAGTPAKRRRRRAAE